MRNRGYFGEFGGQFVSELFYPALTELEQAFTESKSDDDFQKELRRLLSTFAGRPTPLYYAPRLSHKIGTTIYLKREDLMHGGSHKLNNALGQALLAKRMGKKRLITETAAGMHGVATCMAGRAVGLPVDVFMGVKDIARQTINAHKIELLGGTIHPVRRGAGVLKDAVSEAMSVWVEDLPNTHYVIGSAVGPHPYPEMVGYFQKVIGEEIKKQIVRAVDRLPTHVIACGSGGSNAIGAFGAFIGEPGVQLIFIEGGGAGLTVSHHAAVFQQGTIGVFQGTKTYGLFDQYGMDRKTESRSAGLNYPARGPQLAYLFAEKRMTADSVTDEQVLDAYEMLAQLEGIIPAFETAHAIAYLLKRRSQFSHKDLVVVNFSGNGDKDLPTALKLRSGK